MRTLILGLFLFLSSVSFSGITEAKTVSGSRVDTGLMSIPYENEFFSINFPKGWVENTEAEYEPTYVSPNLGAAVSAIVADLGEPIDYDPALRSLWINSFVEEYKEQFEDFKLKGSKTAQIDKVPAFRLDYKYTYDGVPMEGYQVITVKNGFQYMFSVNVTNKSQWRKYNTVITKSLNSLRIRQ